MRNLLISRYSSTSAIFRGGIDIKRARTSLTDLIIPKNTIRIIQTLTSSLIIRPSHFLVTLLTCQTRIYSLQDLTVIYGSLITRVGVIIHIWGIGIQEVIQFAFRTRQQALDLHTISIWGSSLYTLLIFIKEVLIRLTGLTFSRPSHRLPFYAPKLSCGLYFTWAFIIFIQQIVTILTFLTFIIMHEVLNTLLRLITDFSPGTNKIILFQEVILCALLASKTGLHEVLEVSCGVRKVRCFC